MLHFSSAITTCLLCITCILDFIFIPISHQHNYNVTYQEMLVRFSLLVIGELCKNKKNWCMKNQLCIWSKKLSHAISMTGIHWVLLTPRAMLLVWVYHTCNWLIYISLKRVIWSDVLRFILNNVLKYLYCNASGCVFGPLYIALCWQKIFSPHQN